MSDNANWLFDSLVSINNSSPYITCENYFNYKYRLLSLKQLKKMYEIIRRDLRTAENRISRLIRITGSKSFANTLPIMKELDAKVMMEMELAWIERHIEDVKEKLFCDFLDGNEPRPKLIIDYAQPRQGKGWAGLSK